MSTTVWTNGCFDCLHAGHIELFSYAKNRGDRLIVGIDSDDRVRSLKGPSRPLHSQIQRQLVLNSIKFIDEVVVFSSEKELLECIKKFNVSLIVVGSDYRGKRVIGSELVQVEFFERIAELSSTRIIASTEGQSHV